MLTKIVKTAKLFNLFTKMEFKNILTESQYTSVRDEILSNRAAIVSRINTIIISIRSL